jgi:hypothetical protein
MSSNLVPKPSRRSLAGLFRHVGRHKALVIAVLVMVALVLLVTIDSLSAAPAASSAPDSRQYVFTMGTIAQVSDDAITLRFEDGQTETYRLDATTTIQTQNADAQSVDDLEVGNAALVISEESHTTALTIVNGGEAGFHEAGPADIRGHEDACAACETPTP